MKLSVIIPVLNKWELTEACLRSLREHTPGELEVLLVDNASSDATPVEAPVLGAALFGKGFVYLPQPVNRNFAASCNIGARAATGELLFFLNNDTILTPDWLPPLLAALAGDGGGKAPAVVGPLLLYPELAGRKDRVQHLGIVFEPQMAPKHLYEGFPSSHPLCARTRRFQAITGAALLLRRELFMSAGLFDEDFINGFEDVELGLRLTALGHGLEVVYASRIYHLASQTPGIHRHTQHNARMLKQKVQQLIVPDQARFAVADGYMLRVTPSLHVYFDLPGERAAALEVEYREDSSDQALAELLDKEPLWYAGYEYLAEKQQAAGNLQAAAGSLFLYLRFREDPAVAAKLVSLAREMKHSKYAAYAGNMLTLYKPENFPYVVNAVEFMLDFCRRAGMKEAFAAYADWLERKDSYQSLYMG